MLFPGKRLLGFVTSATSKYLPPHEHTKVPKKNQSIGGGAKLVNGSE
jgi:hypothetical protein